MEEAALVSLKRHRSAAGFSDSDVTSLEDAETAASETAGAGAGAGAGASAGAPPAAKRPATDCGDDLSGAADGASEATLEVSRKHGVSEERASAILSAVKELLDGTVTLLVAETAAQCLRDAAKDGCARTLFEPAIGGLRALLRAFEAHPASELIASALCSVLASCTNLTVVTPLDLPEAALAAPGTAMHRHVASRVVVAEAANAMASVAGRISLPAQLLQAFSDGAVAALQVHAADLGVCRAVALHLGNAVKLSAVPLSLPLVQRIVNALTAAVQLHGHDADFLHASCCCLLAVTRQCIGPASVIASCFEAACKATVGMMMAHHAAEHHVVESCTTLVGNCVNYPPSTAHTLLKDGIAAHLTELLSSGETPAESTMHCLDVLRALAYASDDVAPFFASGVVDTAAKMARSGTLQIAQSAGGLLAALAEKANADALEQLLACGIAGVISKGSEDADVTLQLCHLVEQLCRNERCRDALIAERAELPLITAIQRHASSVVICGKCIAALGSLLDKSAKEAREGCIASGIGNALKVAVANNPSSEMVTSGICKLADKLTLNANVATRKQLLEGGVASALCNALAAVKSASGSRCGCSALKRLVQDESSRLQLLQLKAGAALTAVISRFMHGNGDIVATACSLLHILSTNTGRVQSESLLRSGTAHAMVTVLQIGAAHERARRAAPAALSVLSGVFTFGVAVATALAPEISTAVSRMLQVTDAASGCLPS